MKILPKWGSFMPVLINLVNKTRGPILELGCGFNSTPYLHWICLMENRKLVSFENDPKYYRWYSRYNIGNHSVLFVEDWDLIDISGYWDIALIDHKPMERRIIDIERLADKAKYIVAHDTEKKFNKYYRYDKIYHLFKYKTHFKKHPPNTCVLSNIRFPG